MTFPIRLGFWTSASTPWDEVVEQWRTIEELGFDCAGIPDHLMPTGGSVDAPYLEAWVSLSALAALTTRIRIAVLVTGNLYRNPALLAKMAATLDHVSNGRLDLGIGAGWYAEEHRAYGYDFPSAGERVDRLRESIEVVRALMGGGRTSFQGRFYQLDDAPFAPLPVQQGGLPIMIGAQGNRMLRLVAEQGDIWNLNDSPARMAELGAILNRHCAEIGRDPASIRWSAFGFPTVLGHDPFESVEIFEADVRAYVAAGATEVTMRFPNRDQLDTLRRIADRLPALRTELEHS